MNFRVISKEIIINIIDVDENIPESIKRRPGGNTNELQHSGSEGLIRAKYPIV